MLSDNHIHTCFSTDSDADPEAVIRQAMTMGLPGICFTDHYDMDYPTGEFQLDTKDYLRTMKQLKEKYADTFPIRIGVEIGLKNDINDRIREYLTSWDFDYVIGSVHMVDRKDPYYRETFDMTDEEMYRWYFEWTLDHVRQAEGIHALGHLDYVVRYGYNKDRDYSYDRFREIIDEILKVLIRRDICLEVNSAGLKKGIGFAHPHPEILKRYRELGGELLTIGSDGHRPEHIGYMFDEVEKDLMEIGFQTVCEFIGGKPVFCTLGQKQPL